MKRLEVWLGLAGVLLIAAMLALPHLPARMLATAPMGSTLRVTVPGDGSASLYTTHRYWTDFRCTVTGPDGRPVDLRVGILEQDLPGGWQSRGELIDAGKLTITCSSSTGGRFGVGPTRGPGFALLRAALLVVGAGLLIAAGVLAWVKRVRRRRQDPTVQRPRNGRERSSDI